jgi:hypothetical protein
MLRINKKTCAERLLPLRKSSLPAAATTSMAIAICYFFNNDYFLGRHLRTDGATGMLER